MDIQRVVVIGGGTMGNGIAQICAQAGYRVRMVDVSATVLARALEAISGNLDRWVRKGVLDGADRAALLESIETETDAAQGVRDADLVVEAVPELGRDQVRAVPSAWTRRRRRTPCWPATPRRFRSPRSLRARPDPTA